MNLKSNSKIDLLRLISISGQIIEHKSEKMQEHNMDESQLLRALDEKEQETLAALLKKLQKQWFADNKERVKARDNK